MNHTIFFLGMAMLQLVFVSYQFVLFRRKEFFYYILYSVCVTAFIFFKSFPEHNPLSLLVTESERFTAGRSVLLIGYAMYFRFGRHFTETPVRYPRQNRQVVVAEYVFLTFAVIDIILLLNGVPFAVLEPVSQMIYLVAMPFSMYIIVFLITRRRILTSILVIGSGLLLLLASAAFIDLIFISKRSEPVDYYLAYIELGIFLEFLFLNYGLIYKTKLLQKQNTALEVEKQVELYRQRMRISSDLHDEVGATLSGIALYSQLTKEQIRQQQPQKVEQSLDIMQQSAAEMVDKLNDIIWSVNPNEDTLQQLWQKLEEYTQEMGAAKNIRVFAGLDGAAAGARLTMDARRNIYLLCKEAVNNAVKYSGCTELSLRVEVDDRTISFIIRDNGRGFDVDSEKSGNGMQNMRNRSESLGASLEIRSSRDAGTFIRLTCNLPQ
ncbi:MAG TPA: sensor histidine kinase [Flavisolibacter sp.]